MNAIDNAKNEVIRHTQYLANEQERSQRAYENARAAGFDLAEVVSPLCAGPRGRAEDEED